MEAVQTMLFCVQVLGRALKDLPREQIFVATKVGRYGSDTFDFSADRVTKSVHESLERLQVSIPSAMSNTSRGSWGAAVHMHILLLHHLGI